MDTKVKITIITVAALLFVTIGAGLYQTLKPIDTCAVDSPGIEKSKRLFNAKRKSGIRSKVVIKNNRYFFPKKNRPKRRVDPAAMDERVELADELEREMPADFDPNTEPVPGFEEGSEFLGEVPGEEMGEDLAETKLN